MAGLSQIYADGFARDLIPRSTAPTFLSSTSYAVGDYVYYQGNLYRCTTAHTGTWVASHFTAVTIGSELKAKEASLQSEIDDVKSDLSNAKNGGYTVSQTNIVQGSYGSTSPYIITSSTTRIRTEQPLYVSKGETLSIKKGTNCSYYAVGFYTTAGAWIREQNWLTVDRSFDITDDMLIVIAFHNSDNSTITPSDYDAVVSVNTPMQGEIDELSASVLTYENTEILKAELLPVSTLHDVGWTYGYVTTGGVIANASENITNVQYIFAKAGTVITPSDGYRFKVGLYREPKVSGYYDMYSFRDTALTLPSDNYIRISIANGSPATEITDIPTALNKFTISSGTAFILNPSIYADVAEAEYNYYARIRFVKAMNDKAEQIGMTDSVFADVAGYDTETNITTARDLVKLGVEACSYNRLCRVWNTNEHTIKTLDKNHREILCEYTDDVSVLENAYTLLGKKAGYMPLSGGGSSYTMVAVCVVGDNVVVGAIGGATSRENRPKAMKELMDKVASSSSTVPTLYQYGCACILPKGNVSSYERKELDFVYEYNADTQFVPASTTKVLTAITALDYITDLHSKFVVLTGDGLDYGSGQLIQAGDILNFEQALYLMMLPSSGPCCRTVARTLGQKMIIAYD